MKLLKLKTLVFVAAILFFGCSKDDDIQSEGEEGNSPDPNAIVSIPDANFKAALLDYNTVIDTNNDGEIQVSEAKAVAELWVTNKNINDLTGIEYFINLDELHIDGNTYLDEVDVSKLVKLKKLIANFTALSSIDLTKNLKLTLFDCFKCLNLEQVQVSTEPGKNKIESLNISGVAMTNLNTQNYEHLKYITFRGAKLTSLDLSSNTELQQVFGNDTPALTKLNVKTGNIAQISDVQVYNCPNLTSICVDDVAAADGKDPERWKKDSTTVYTENCN
ncbi:hypothetical protein [Aequorivita marina]|uniref:hypothetical protein n=1 Tax=Aequorivita marina TaxID=3073654 RepID=UPI002875757C|nr:hypothetical protein [Aequorivita sp. S2608]MDS1299336.1 hypothetical protein [Aequorivita sp. S2608]